MATAAADAGNGVRMGTAKGRWILLACILGSSMAQLDATVVNVALNRIGVELDADFAGLQWIVNAYTLTLAALILLGGALGDRHGRRRVFLFGVTWFALASLLCAVAPSAGFLVAARALQGVGGALLTPGSLAMIAASFDPVDRSKAVGAWSAFGGIAGAIGPFVGGWLVEWNWRMVFVLNLPLAVLVIVVARLHVPESKDPATVKGFDLTGTVLGAAGLGILTYGLIAAGRRGFDPVVVLLVVVALVALGTFLLVERRSSHPLVALDLFTNRTFTAINLVTFVVYAALGVFFFLLVLDLQVVAGFSPLAAGTALLPVTAIMLLLSSRSGALADRIGARIPLTVGPLLAACGLLLTLRIGAGSTYLGGVVPPVLVFGLGLSLTVAPLTATVLASAPARHAGIASGVNNAVARAAGLLSVAVIPVVAGLSGQAYTHPDAMSDGFKRAMMFSAALLLVGGALSWALVRTPSRAAPSPSATAADRGHGAAGAASAGAASSPAAVPDHSGPGAVAAHAAPGSVPGQAEPGSGSDRAAPDAAPGHATPGVVPGRAAPDAVPGHATPGVLPDRAAPGSVPGRAAPGDGADLATPGTGGGSPPAGAASSVDRAHAPGSPAGSRRERDAASRPGDAGHIAEAGAHAIPAEGTAATEPAAVPTGAAEAAPAADGVPAGTSASPPAATDAAEPDSASATGTAAVEERPRLELAKYLHCGITGPQLHPTDPGHDR